MYMRSEYIDKKEKNSNIHRYLEKYRYIGVKKKGRSKKLQISRKYKLRGGKKEEGEEKEGRGRRCTRCVHLHQYSDRIRTRHRPWTPKFQWDRAAILSRITNGANIPRGSRDGDCF